MKAEDKIEAFEGFRRGMYSFITLFQFEEGIKHKKSSIAHRIANCISVEFPSYRVDIETLGADIIVWDGNDDIRLAIFWSEQYLSEKEKTKAFDFQKTMKPGLTLGLTILPDKSWILVYRFESNHVEYLHIDKENFSDDVVRQKFFNNEDTRQLKLSLRRKKS